MTRKPNKSRHGADKKRPRSDRPRGVGRPDGRPEGRPGARAEAIRLMRPDSVLLYGRNSVLAALKNPERQILRLMATEKAFDALEKRHIPESVRVERLADPAALSAHYPEGAPHQGLFLEVAPLEGGAIEDLEPIEGRKNIILMLDQVTDPHNVGACIRSAAAFGSRAIITQDRNSPLESGTLARASAGGLELIPWVRAANLAQALETLKDMGYWHIGLDGHTDASIRDADMGDNIVIVMGSEGKGLRPLVKKHCDLIAKIPMQGAVESLNVSNAAAIALYALS